MPLNFDAVGVASPPHESRWTSKDCLLYAVGVGAGAPDPLQELSFTTENTAGVPQQVLPTFAVVAARGGGRGPSIGDIDRTKLVHAEQAVMLHAPLPVEGHVRTTSTVTGMYDKGSGALVATESVSLDAASGVPLFTTRSSVFIRGEGGFGGSRGPAGAPSRPTDRGPDHEISYPTRPEQALIYRLSGDRNPLHADPAFARRGGFDRPILHGLCTYGFTGRALLAALCGGDPARFSSMAGRFSAPVWPGDTLTILVWDEGEGRAAFQTRRQDGTVVIDAGAFAHAG